MTKYIFVTGGVLSSLGKGISSASIAALLKQSGFDVSMLKIDPYLNVDPGTMSPLEHGEVFVTADGGETDLDLGHYERFIDKTLGKMNNFTTGQVYSSVIQREREGGYLGKTIQVIPHIVDEIKNRVYRAGDGHEFLIVELGGTVGDIEGLPFMEAVREIRHENPKTTTMNIHVTLVPYISAAGELKTKPTQHSVQELRRIGIMPHMLICRTERKLPEELKRKLAYSCDVDEDAIIEAGDAKSIYEVPMKFLNEGILKYIAKHFEMEDIVPDMNQWDNLVKHIVAPKDEITIAFVGKYLELKEAYKSLTEALIHSGAHLNTRVVINWCDSEIIEQKGAKAIIAQSDCVLVAGGFGQRGVDGKIAYFPIAENVHKNGILDTTTVPANINSDLEQQIKTLAYNVATAINYVGVLAIEFFISKTGEVMVNEMAPRPHNSGHYTMNACHTSQFEQQVRAMAHLPLGDTTLVCPTVMLNILGDSWKNGEPDWKAILNIDKVFLHLYGKKQARNGRKMGHINVLADSAENVSKKIVKLKPKL